MDVLYRGTMRMIMYQMEQCPFCKHFIRMFKNEVQGGEIVSLDGHNDPRWQKFELNYVPTVIAYDEEGNEASRLESVAMVGIRKDRWHRWLSDLNIEEGKN